MTAEQQMSLDIYVTCDIEDEWGAAASDLDAKYFDRAQGFEGGDMLITGGYSKIFNGIADREPVVLETTVSTIQQNTIGCQVSTNSGQSYCCDFVICTVPLGVLKKQIIKFDPPLSNQKLTSIEKMGFKTLNKIFVIFESVFWGNDSNIIYYKKKESNDLQLAVNLHKTMKNNMIMFFVPDTYNIHTKSESEVHNQVINLIHEFMPESVDIGYKISHTSWADDKFAYGAYSSYAPGCHPDDVKELGRMEGRVAFAGEHTALEYMSTVHGAWLSSLHAATLVMEEME